MQEISSLSHTGPILVAGLVLNAGAVAACYNAGDFWAPLTWSMMVVSMMLVNVLFSALGAELFPRRIAPPPAVSALSSAP